MTAAEGDSSPKLEMGRWGDGMIFGLYKRWAMNKEFNTRIYIYYIYIYDPGSRFATTPPPHGMVPKPAFCSIPHENVVFAVFFAWWVAGAVRNPANSLDFCNQPSENVLFAMFRLRHRGVVPPRPLLFLCQISYNSKSSTNGFQPRYRSDICLYLMPVELSLRVSSFP